MHPHHPRFLYHPPTEHLSWTLEKEYPWLRLSEEIDAKIGSKGPSWEKILWHGGFYLNKIRLSEETLPKTFPSGSRFDLYFFLREPQELPITPNVILREEEGWLAADKPAWLPVQGSRTSLRFSLQEGLRKMIGCKGLSAIHRLDRETSGVVIFAKNKKMEALLMKQFHDQNVSKSYLAVVSPIPSQKHWHVEGYLARDFRRLPQDFYRLRPDPRSKGKWSETDFEVLKEEGGLALISASPKTGRTHQIRVHLAHGGSPIKGDRVYGGQDSEVDRMQLHALSLKLALGGKSGADLVEITAPMPQDFILR